MGEIANVKLDIMMEGLKFVFYVIILVKLVMEQLIINVLHVLML